MVSELRARARATWTAEAWWRRASRPSRFWSRARWRPITRAARSRGRWCCSLHAPGCYSCRARCSRWIRCGRRHRPRCARWLRAWLRWRRHSARRSERCATRSERYGTRSGLSARRAKWARGLGAPRNAPCSLPRNAQHRRRREPHRMQSRRLLRPTRPPVRAPPRGRRRGARVRPGASATACATLSLGGATARRTWEAPTAPSRSSPRAPRRSDCVRSRRRRASSTARRGRTRPSRASASCSVSPSGSWVSTARPRPRRLPPQHWPARQRAPVRGAGVRECYQMDRDNETVRKWAVRQRQVRGLAVNTCAVPRFSRCHPYF